MKNSFLIIFWFVPFTLFGQNWCYEIQTDNELSEGIAINNTEDGYILGAANVTFELSEDGILSNQKHTQQTDQAYFKYVDKLENDDVFVKLKNNLTRRTTPLNDVVWEKNIPNSTCSFVLKDGDNYITIENDSIFSTKAQDGSLNWRNRLPSHSKVLVRDSSNYIVVSGSGRIKKLDLIGNEVAAFTLPFYLIATQIKVVADGYIIVGEVAAGLPMRACKINKNGDLIWVNTYSIGTIHDFVVDGTDIICVATHNYIMSVLKIDNQGVLSWKKEYEDGVYRGKAAIVKANNQQGYVVMNSKFIIKIDKDGLANPSKEPLYIGGFEFMEVNNISALMIPGNEIFGNYKRPFIKGHYKAPHNTINNTLGRLALWVEGYDVDRNLLSAAFNFESGQIGTNEFDWSKIWTINKSDIKKLIRDFEKDGSIDEPIPLDIIGYPAFGNVNAKGFGERPVQVAFDLVPFVDRNNDGIYNVYDGDYPIIKGDKMMVWCFKDTGPSDPYYEEDSLHINVVGRIYGYDCPANEILNNTLFLNYTIHNASSQTIDSMKIGLNALLGSSGNQEYLGSDIATNTFYAYSRTVGAVPLQNPTLPIQTITLLDKPMEYFMYCMPDGIGDSFIGCDFFSPNGRNKLMNSQWLPWNRDLTYGGYGGEPSNPRTFHAFPDNPIDPLGWSMFMSGIPTYEYFGTAAFKTGNLPQDARTSFEVAIVTHQNPVYPQGSIIPDVTTTLNDVQNLQQTYDNNQLEWSGAIQPHSLSEEKRVTLNTSTDNTYQYEWSTGATTSTIDVIHPAIYMVTITDNNGCTQTDEIMVDIEDFDRSVEPIDNVNILPNPTSDAFNIIYLHPTDIVFTGKLYDARGRLLETKELITNTSNKWDVQSLAVGVYFLNIEIDKKVIGTKKVIIVR